MLSKSSKLKLEKHMEARKRNIARLLYITYRHFNEWSQVQWKKDGWGEMRPDHLKLVAIIGMEPVNNNELAKRARVSKQAMSKMVNSLIEQGFVAMEQDPNDSRANIISITDKGVDFLVYLKQCGKGFETKIHSILGPKKTEQLIDLMSELAEGIIAEERALYWNK